MNLSVKKQEQSSNVSPSNQMVEFTTANFSLPPPQLVLPVIPHYWVDGNPTWCGAPRGSRVAHH